MGGGGGGLYKGRLISGSSVLTVCGNLISY